MERTFTIGEILHEYKVKLVAENQYFINRIDEREWVPGMGTLSAPPGWVIKPQSGTVQYDPETKSVNFIAKNNLSENDLPELLAAITTWIVNSVD